jgi:hypothetical protein
LFGAALFGAALLSAVLLSGRIAASDPSPTSERGVHKI